MEERALKQRRRLRIKTYFAIGVFSLGAILIFGFFARAPFLNFKEIKVEGLSRVSSRDVLNILRVEKFKNSLVRYLGYGSMIFWRDGDMDLGVNFPIKINVEANIWERVLVVKVEDRERFLVWCRGGDCYWVDENGIILESAPIAEGQLVNTIYDDDEIPLVSGETVLKSKQGFLYLKNILEIVQKNKIPVKKVFVDAKDGSMRMETTWGTDLFFSLRFDPAFTAVLEQLGARFSLSKMEYVDFRVENKIYYKSRD